MRPPSNVLPIRGPDGLGTLAGATALIPPGEYLLAFRHHEIVWQFCRPKLVLYFRVVTPGPWFDVVLARYYAVRSVATKTRRKGGDFTCGQKGDYFREYCRVIGAPTRPDRITPLAYRNTVVMGEVVTVMTGHDRLPIPEGARYSKISRLVRLEAGRP